MIQQELPSQGEAGDDMENFTHEELQIAKSVDLVEVARSLGYTPIKIGKYYSLKEMDSMRIYDRSHWCRFSRRYEKGEGGGSQIDFLKVFAGMDVKSAVFWLLDFAGYTKISTESYDKPKITLRHQIKPQKKETVKREFCLPEPAYNNNYLYRYLQQDRGLSREVIDYFVSRNLIYESRKFHNIVFKGIDTDGQVRFASMRGVFDKQGKRFRCDVTGSDKNYGFNITNPNSDELVVFEAAIDLMSYVDIYKDFESNMLALGMVSDAPLERFLIENPGIRKISFGLDNDAPGREATKSLMEKYKKRGFWVRDMPSLGDCKDYNEWLIMLKQQKKNECR